MRRLEQELYEKRLQNRKFMNPGSKKILRESSRSLSKSERKGQFLRRNYPSWKEKSVSRATSTEFGGDTSPTREMTAGAKNHHKTGSKVSLLNTSI
jgi:hypothetical protein